MERSNRKLKIIICTSFREFNGSENHKIQDLFLQGLKKQTYTNYVLVATIFNEKTVEEYLTSNFNNNHLILKHNPLKSFRYSQTILFLNAIDEALRYENAIIVWTTCDVIFQKNFFEKIVENFTSFTAGTSHPHYSYKDILSYKKKKNPLVSPANGIDTIYFDAEIFRNEYVYNVIQEYKNYDWGIYEHFLTAIADKFAETKVNIFLQSRISKVVNDRVASNDTKNYMKCSLDRNRLSYNKFLEIHQMDNNFDNLVYCNYIYKLPKDKYKYYKMFWKFYMRYLINMIKKKIKLLIKKIIF